MGRGSAGGGAVAAGRKASEAGTKSRKAAQEKGAGVTGESRARVESIIDPMSPGAPIGLVELRQRAALPREQFNSTVQSLITEGKLVGHRHDFTGNLTEAQRAQLVPVVGKPEPNRTHYAYVTKPQ